jgi:3',5'-cyclic AMP phosphodiesterase CpdA
VLALGCSGGARAAITVYAAGDIAYCTHADTRWSGAAATAALVQEQLALDPQAAVLLLGDNVYPRGALADYLRCYHPTWGRFKARTHPAPGNREYASAGAAGYFAYFGAAAGRGYYRLRLGSWAVYSLDSNLAGAAMAAQLAWLKSSLDGDTAECTLAYWHHPLYSSGGHGNIATMRPAWELLQAAGAELVLSGHDHDYERFAPQDAHGMADRRGIRQFVVGTGGAFATPLLWPRPHSEARDANRDGVLKLVLDEGRYTWEFLAVPQDDGNGAARLDRGSAACH